MQAVVVGTVAGVAARRVWSPHVLARPLLLGLLGLALIPRCRPELALVPGPRAAAAGPRCWANRDLWDVGEGG